jgi:hypothetical protein
MGEVKQAGKPRRRWLVVVWIVVCVAIAALAGGAAYWKQQAQRCDKLDEQSKSNFYALQEAIEKYKAAQAEGRAPQTLDELMAQGYLASIPANPYSGEPMRRLRITEPSRPGDYSYYPAPANPAASTEVPGMRSGYYLLVYGSAFSKHDWHMCDCWTLAHLPKLLPKKRILCVEVDDHNENGLEMFRQMVIQYEGQFKSTT